MSYTAPDYVDTKSQAILALASTIADEDKTALGDGSVNKALDVLADVLAESDVQVPQTNAGAILALAQYASGMIKPTGAISITENGEGIDVAQYATADVSVSGGGVDVGNMQKPTYVFEALPSVGDSFNLASEAVSYDFVMIDNSVIAGPVIEVASGASVMLLELEITPTIFSFGHDAETAKITSVEELTVEWEPVEYDSKTGYAFEMPDVNGKFLGCVFVEES